MKILKTKLLRDHSPPFKYFIISNFKKFIMKALLIFINIIAFSLTTKAQLDKGTWLVGGVGNFLSSKIEYTSPTFSYTSNRVDISVSPKIGYLIIDKLGVGLITSFSKYKEQINGPGGGYTNENRFAFGPFAKYYFLEKGKQYNILTELNYQYGLYSFKPIKGNSQTFNAAVGPVVYFNTNVGLEFLLGYYSTKETIRQSGDIIRKQSGFQIGIGFQIHLEN